MKNNPFSSTSLKTSNFSSTSFEKIKFSSIRPSYLNALVTVLEMLIAAGGEGKKIKKITNKKVKNSEIKNMLNSYYEFR